MAFIITDLWNSRVNIEQINFSTSNGFDNNHSTFINELKLNTTAKPTEVLPLRNITLSTDEFWDFSRETCIYIYSTLMILLVLFTLSRGFIFFSICMKASTNLHDNMFQSITRATMRFFNTNSAGRILNRFSKVVNYLS